ncbi:hypothetical protein B0H16DRAFT_284443 [Mycena metata]|nr:hypothetical protein B0H16DRAFT_284443 [Mycena metata]
MADPKLPFHPSMIGPSASFYPDPQWDYPQQQQFDFAYPAPGVSYEELMAQYYPQQPQQNPQQHPQPVQHPVYPPVQSPNNRNPNSNTSPNANPNVRSSTANTSPPPTTSSGSAPKRKRTAKKAAPVPQPAYSDNSDSDDGFGTFGGGAGISVGMGGLGVRSKGARLPGACTHCKKLKMKCDFGPGGSGSPGRDPTDNTCRRCRAGGHVCIVEGRKPRSAPN